MKKCPFCSEEIQNNALKCRHCREFIEQPNPQPANPLPKNKIVSASKSTQTPVSFTGFLWFFQLQMWIGGILFAVMTPLLFLVLGSEVSFANLLICFELIASLYLYLMLASILKRPESNTPIMVRDIIAAVVIVSVLCSGIELVSEYFKTHGNWTKEQHESLRTLFRGTFRSAMWSGIWWSYFQKSKQVHTYYGTNQQEIAKIDTLRSGIFSIELAPWTRKAWFSVIGISGLGFILGLFIQE